jgi:hypothetical protein
MPVVPNTYSRRGSLGGGFSLGEQSNSLAPGVMGIPSNSQKAFNQNSYNTPSDFGFTPVDAGPSDLYGNWQNQGGGNQGGASNFSMGNFSSGNVTQGNNPYIKQMQDLPTGYTPQQMLMMRNKAQSTAGSFNKGASEAIKSAMAAQGLSGGGAEIQAIANAQRGKSQDIQNALSNQDISNANTDLQNQYAKANMIGNSGMNWANLGENQKQFNQNLDANMYQWGNQENWNRQQYAQQQNQQNQLAQMMMGMFGKK